MCLKTNHGAIKNKNNQFSRDPIQFDSIQDFYPNRNPNDSEVNFQYE